MEYWTILWVTVLGGELDGSTSGLVYPTLMQCEDATKMVSATLPYDHSLICEESTVLSMSIRPQPRPEELTE
jgi:hypothetical protein